VRSRGGCAGNFSGNGRKRAVFGNQRAVLLLQEFQPAHQFLFMCPADWNNCFIDDQRVFFNILDFGQVDDKGPVNFQEPLVVKFIVNRF
jgi:hypothetical protein